MGWRKKALIGVVSTTGIGAAGVVSLLMTTDKHAQSTERHVSRVKNGLNHKPRIPFKPRSDQLESLKSETFDVVVIGGGATGCGCALDSVTRGLKTAMIDLDDFSSGTSSRSTKLIHGGVRYLQKAIYSLDYEQYQMVREALHERANLLNIAPHLSFPLPIMLPVYTKWQLYYYWLGIKVYDLVSGEGFLKPSYMLSKDKALEKFSMLNRDKLQGAIVYYDGSHNDARMCISIGLTAARYGATIANHCKAVSLIKDENGKVCAVKMRDELTGEEWTTKTKCVINATGPFTDSIRQLDDSETPKIVCPSSGVHIILPDYYSPSDMGLIDPSTSDGRVIFFLPWQKFTIAGTTDTQCEVSHSPSPTEKDIQFILNEVKNYLTPDIEVRRGDVLSAWSGIRPLVMDPNKSDTQSLVRNHVIHVSKSGMVTIAGGKWTTYRAMAKETLDASIEACSLKPKEKTSQTDGLLLEGAHTWTPTMFIRLVQDYGLDSEIAQHLSETYGDRAFSVAKIAGLTGCRWPVVGKRLHPEFPYIEAEVRYAVKEYAATAVDVISRRLRIAFLSAQAAEETLPRVVEIMGEELKWSEKEKRRQMEEAKQFLSKEMGMHAQAQSVLTAALNKNELSEKELSLHRRQFDAIDVEKKGFISINDIRKLLKKSGQQISEDNIHTMLREIDTNNNGKCEYGEYLQLMSAVKTGLVSHSRFAHLAASTTESADGRQSYGQKMERSGGGI